MESKRWIARALALALVVPAAFACSKAEKSDETIEVKTETPPPTAPVSVTINPQGGSTISGDLTATHEADKTTLRLNLANLDESKDYKAKIRYGDCTLAMQYLTDTDEPGEIDKDKAPAATTATPENTGAPMAGGAHQVGDVVARLGLDKTGASATGTADADNDKLRPGEAAYLVVTEDMGMGKPDMLVGCADLTGHDTGMMGAPAGGSMGTPGETTPGAAMPEDSGKK